MNRRTTNFLIYATLLTFAVILITPIPADGGLAKKNFEVLILQGFRDWPVADLNCRALDGEWSLCTSTMSRNDVRQEIIMECPNNIEAQCRVPKNLPYGK